MKLRVKRLEGVLTLAVCALFVGCSADDGKPLAARTIELRGETVAARSADVVVPFDSVVRRVAVSDGQHVSAGDVLFELSSPDLDRAAALSRAQRELAEERLAAASSQQPESIETVSSEMLARKKQRRDRYLTLYRSHDVSLQELEDAQNDYDVSLRELAMQRQNGSASAQRKKVAEIELAQARADEQLASSRLGMLLVRSPIEGIVSGVSASESRIVSAREPLARVVSTGALELHADVAPDLLRLIRPGTPVQARVLTVPPRVFLQTVSRVIPLEAGTSSEARARIVVDIPNADGTIAPGTPAILTIEPRA